MIVPQSTTANCDTVRSPCTPVGNPPNFISTSAPSGKVIFVSDKEIMASIGFDNTFLNVSPISSILVHKKLDNDSVFAKLILKRSTNPQLLALTLGKDGRDIVSLVLSKLPPYPPSPDVSPLYLLYTSTSFPKCLVILES